MAEHNTLTGSSLHEPKGVATASAGEVYTSDGLGSGAWSVAPGFYNTKVIVRDISDLPDPVSGNITLVAGTTYILDGSISLGANTLTYSNDTFTFGHNGLVDGFTYTGTGSMINSSNQFGMIAHFLTTTNLSSSVFNLSGATNDTVIMSRNFITAGGSMGTIDNRGITAMDNMGVVGAPGGGFLFTGSHNRLTVADGFFISWTGTMFDLNGATFNYVTFGEGNQFTVASGSVGIDGLVSSGNLNSGGRGIIGGNIFNGAGTYISGIAASDLQWEFGGNQGVTDSATLGGYSKDSGRDDTVLMTSTPVKIVGTSTLAAASERFDDGSADNRLSYIGLEDVKVSLGGTVVGQSSGGSSITCDITAVTTSGIVDVISGVEFPTGADASFSFQVPVELSNLDTIELWITRTSGSQNLDCSFFQMFAVSG